MRGRKRGDLRVLNSRYESQEMESNSDESRTLRVVRVLRWLIWGSKSSSGCVECRVCAFFGTSRGNKKYVFPALLWSVGYLLHVL